MAKAKGKPESKKPEKKPDVAKLAAESHKTAEKILKECGLPKELIERIKKDEPAFMALANALANAREEDRELRVVVNELADVAPEITKLEETLEAVQGKVKRTKNELDVAYKREHEAVKKLRAIRSGEYQTTMAPVAKDSAGKKDAGAEKDAAIKKGAKEIDAGLRAVTAEMLGTSLEDLASKDECEALADLLADPKVQKSGVSAARVAKSLWNSSKAKDKANALDLLDRLAARGPLAEVVGTGGKVSFHLKDSAK